MVLAITVLIIVAVILITMHVFMIYLPNHKEEKAWFDMMTDISRARRTHYTAVRHDYRYKKGE